MILGKSQTQERIERLVSILDCNAVNSNVDQYTSDMVPLLSEKDKLYVYTILCLRVADILGSPSYHQ